METEPILKNLASILGMKISQSSGRHP